MSKTKTEIPAEFHSVLSGLTCRVSKKVAQQVIEHCPSFWMGYLYDVTCKHVGAGVYELKRKPA